jgi:hypothetical protein
MVDGEENEADAKTHRQKAAASLGGLTTNTVDVLHHSVLAVWIGLEDRPILRAIVVGLVSTALTSAIVTVAGLVYSFFFTRSVTIQGTIDIETFPLPVGFTLWILTILWVGTALWATIRIAELREEIEAVQQ